MKYFILLVTFLSGLISHAGDRRLVCGKEVTGKLNATSTEFTWIDKSRNKPQTVVSKIFAGPVDERCGTLSKLNSLNFEITPRHMWGQVILQIFTSVDGKVQARIHRCLYDGDYSDFDDTDYDCTLQ